MTRNSDRREELAERLTDLRESARSISRAKLTIGGVLCGLVLIVLGIALVVGSPAAEPRLTEPEPAADAPPTSAALGVVKDAETAALEQLRADPAISQALELMNRERQLQKLPLLTLDIRLSETAADHNNFLASSGKLCHSSDCNPQDAPSTSQFQKWGENVGYYGEDDIEALHEAFMDSPDHRENILDESYKQVGIAYAQAELADGTTAWFMTVQFGLSKT